jgi:hypothetical protein
VNNFVVMSLHSIFPGIDDRPGLDEVREFVEKKNNESSLGTRIITN